MYNCVYSSVSLIMQNIHNHKYAYIYILYIDFIEGYRKTRILMQKFRIESVFKFPQAVENVSHFPEYCQFLLSRTFPNCSVPRSLARSNSIAHL